MRNLTIGGLTCVLIFFIACRGTPDEKITEAANGSFKILIRSQEFHHSGIVNVDICVTEASAHKFPKSRSCFLHGFDFDHLSAKWISSRTIEISFGCGRVTYFTNDAFIYPNGAVAENFHAKLLEKCSYAG